MAKTYEKKKKLPKTSRTDPVKPPHKEGGGPPVQKKRGRPRGPNYKEPCVFTGTLKEDGSMECLICKKRHIVHKEGGGPPVQYDPTYPEKIIKWLEGIEPYREIENAATGAVRFIGSDMIFKHQVARKICKTTPGNLDTWAKLYPELEEALKRVTEKQMELLAINTLLGNYNPTFAIFMAKNTIGWRNIEDVRNTHLSTTMSELLAAVESETAAGKPIYLGQAEEPASVARIEDLKAAITSR